jgi:hypothetical protein
MSIQTFPFFRLSAMVTAVGLAAVALVHATGPSIAQVQDTQQKAGKVEGKSPMARCMDTWDRAAQMSKQEWKETCKRTIKENPGLYNKAF